MQKFNDVLLEIEDAEVNSVKDLELYDENSQLAGVVHNKPGSAGSAKVYYHLYKTFGEINTDAAVEGLSLFAEHTRDAEDNPGKHPNIDRLFDIIDSEKTLTVKIIDA